MSQVYAQQAQAQAASLENSTFAQNFDNNCEKDALDSAHPQSTDSSEDSESRESYLQKGLEKPSSNIRRKNRIRCVNEKGDVDDEEESDVSDEEGASVEDTPRKFP